jgi:CheY-like chemotaxis protein
VPDEDIDARTPARSFAALAREPANMKPETLKILIVTDVSADAAQIVRLLEDKFEQLETSTIESHFVADFERVKPDVVVLAFPSLERAERYSLGLYRHSAIVHALPHRSIVLCDKDNVHRAFELCSKEYFDDYVMYWPLVYDTPRLAMSILIAGRSLQRQRDTAPAREVAAHARSVSRLEAVIDDRIAVGQQHAAALNQALQAMEAGVAVTPAQSAGSPDVTAIVHAPPPPPAVPAVHFELETGAAETFDLDLDDLPSGLDRQTLISPPGPAPTTAPTTAHSPAPAPTIAPHSDVIREVRLRVDDAQKRVVPLTEWIGGLKQDVKPQLDAARRLGELASTTPLRILVVDDDSFQCKLLERMLGTAGYATLFAHSGAEALALLGRQHPDLILMDVALPDLNGVEITQRLKASPGTAAIPIMMITGHSERPVLAASLKAGAVDFLVKPFDREVLLQKITHHLAH